jgi:hypothetical protein
MEGIFNPAGFAPEPAYVPKNEQEAWIAIMHACIAVDEEVAEEELEVLSNVLAGKTMFEGHDTMAYAKKVFYAQAKIGSKQLIDSAVDLIPQENRATLFALTIQLVLSDCLVADKEKELIQYLYSALDLEGEFANKIVEVVLILNKGNVCP